MTKEKLKRKYLILIFLILSLMLNLYWGWYFYPNWFPHDVSIPSEQQINNFCVDKGYSNGWLSSSSCQENQVECHSYSKLFDTHRYDCLDWIK